jgi:hypothetical protein
LNGGYDLCGFTNNAGSLSSSGSFDPNNGDFTFQSNDIVSFPPGEYKFEITVSVGTQETVVEYVMNLISPCADATLTYVSDEFNGVAFIYVLNEAQEIEPQFNPSTWFTSSADPVYCGAPVVEFYKANPRGTLPIDSIFSADQSGAEPFDFKAGSSSDLSKVGEYNMYWRFYYANAPLNYVDAPSDFKYIFVDGCDPDYASITTYTLEVIPTPTVNPPTLVT